MNDLEKLHQVYLEEVTEASESFFAWKEINDLGFNDDNIHKLLAQNGRTWQIIIHSLQTSTFITLGRIFDGNGESFSVDRLLKMFIEESDKLGVEKVSLTRIRGEISKIRNQFIKEFQPIRHKVLAHRDANTIGNEDEIFGKTTIGSLQNILFFLYQVGKILSEVLEKKHVCNIGDFEFITEKYMREDVQSLLKKLN